MEMPSTSIATANKADEEVLVAKDCETERHYVKRNPAHFFKIGKMVAEIGIAQALRFYKKYQSHCQVS